MIETLSNIPSHSAPKTAAKAGAAAILATLAFLAARPMASAATVTVGANADIYYAGQESDPTGGQVPTAIVALPGLEGTVSFGPVLGSIACGVSTEGCVSLINGQHLNDPDGTGGQVATSSNTGANGISGLTAPGTGYLVGVFLTAGGPSGQAPAALNFVASGTSFASLSPLLDQAFFIGDGLTGDGSGATQVFAIPAGATELVLGVSDACQYNGAPGCWRDNVGSYNVTYAIEADQSVSSTVPEPASLALLGASLAGLAAARRRR